MVASKSQQKPCKAMVYNIEIICAVENLQNLMFWGGGLELIECLLNGWQNVVVSKSTPASQGDGLQGKERLRKCAKNCMYVQGFYKVQRR